MFTLDYIKYIASPEKLTNSCLTATKILVVIPCFNESGLTTTLKSLNACIGKNHFEVIVCINYGERLDDDIKSNNELTYANLLKETSNHDYEYPVHPLLVPNLPHKIAGVGMARKIGMDYACSLFKGIEYNGVLACLDADCTVESNYINAIVEFFDKNDVEAAGLHYEHPFPEDAAAKSFIIDYELHLRYHVDFQKWLELPFAYQTIGSSMAVRKDAYLKEGGMNKRKAGEDFYFIHKYSMKGTLGEIKTTTVLPSARVSDRVPFGTGKAIQDRLDGITPGTYNPKSYEALVPLIENVSKLYSPLFKWSEINLEPCIAEYLKTQDIESILKEIKKNTTSEEAFVKRFYQYFNAFRLMKYLHFSRDNYYPNISVHEAAKYLYELLVNKPKDLTTEEYLLWFRELDKKD